MQKFKKNGLEFRYSRLFRRIKTRNAAFRAKGKEMIVVNRMKALSRRQTAKRARQLEEFTRGLIAIEVFYGDGSLADTVAANRLYDHKVQKLIRRIYGRR